MRKRDCAKEQHQSEKKKVTFNAQKIDMKILDSVIKEYEIEK